MTSKRMTATALLGLATLIPLTALQGCAPLVMGGAMVGSVMVASDRRTAGAQVEDESIEIKASSAIDALGTQGHVNVTSYNRLVLLSGEAPSQADKARIEGAVVGVANVRTVVNELVVAGNAGMSSRSNDTFLTSQVKASLLEAKDLTSTAIKVVTERAVVYLLGRVTEREASRATALASTVPGVHKVVRVFEVISEEELARLLPKPPEKK
jgi:osmotically-inducible protein OsmY